MFFNIINLIFVLRPMGRTHLGNGSGPMGWVYPSTGPILIDPTQPNPEKSDPCPSLEHGVFCDMLVWIQKKYLISNNFTTYALLGKMTWRTFGKRTLETRSNYFFRFFSRVFDVFGPKNWKFFLKFFFTFQPKNEIFRIIITWNAQKRPKLWQLLGTPQPSL